MISDRLPSILVSSRIMNDKMSKNVREPRLKSTITQSEGDTPGAWSRYIIIKVRFFCFAVDHTSFHMQSRKKNSHGKEILRWKSISKPGFTINDGHIRCYFLCSYSSVNVFMLAVGEKERFVYVLMYYISSKKQIILNNSQGKVIKSR